MYILTKENSKFTTLKLIAENGDFLGVVNLNEALHNAQNKKLDLVCINEKSSPPLCKITDFGKLQYNQKKKLKDSKSKKIVLKEIQIRPNTDDHDLEIKAKKVMKFLSQGNRVKIRLSMQGRENNNLEFAKNTFNQFLDKIGTYDIESNVNTSHNNIMIVIKPQKQE